MRSLGMLVDGGSFYESPRWHGGTWWVSDFYRHGVYTVDAASGEEALQFEVPGQPSGLGWMPDGTLLVVSMKDRQVLKLVGDRTLALHSDIGAFCGGPANDMVVDRNGRAWVGNFGFDLMAGEDAGLANLVRVDPDGAASVAAGGLAFPNGSVITPDGGTLIVGETIGSRYTAFTIGSDGALSDRRVWAQVAEPPPLGPLAEMIPLLTFGPDGCTLDAEGHLWSADEAGARCVRLAPGGAIVDEVSAPEGQGVFACMLGGEEGTTLLMCCAPDFYEHARRDTREASLWTCTVDVPAAGLP